MPGQARVLKIIGDFGTGVLSGNVNVYDACIRRFSWLAGSADHTRARMPFAVVFRRVPSAWQ